MLEIPQVRRDVLAQSGPRETVIRINTAFSLDMHSSAMESQQ